MFDIIVWKKQQNKPNQIAGRCGCVARERFLGFFFFTQSLVIINNNKSINNVIQNWPVVRHCNLKTF